MEIWNFSGITGELLSAGVADADPLRDGEWIVPAFATTLAPPVPPAGHVAVFTSGEWTSALDHRGEIWFDPDCVEVRIQSLGPVPEGLSSTPPEPPGPTPDQLADQITAFRNARLRAGFADAVTGKTFECDDGSITKWNAIASASGFAILFDTTPAPTFPLIPADNSTIVLPAADAFALMSARIMPWVSATILYARTMKDAVLAGDPPADITAGWP